MASSWTLYGIVLIVSAFATGVNARPGPCKILYISSFTVNFQNPNPNHLQIDNSPPRTFFTILDIYQPQAIPTPIEMFVERGPSFDSRFLYRRSVPNHLSLNRNEEETVHFNHQHKSDSDSDSDSFGVSSLRERTKDILSVVAALLFGVGCGVLTSATMYLAWSLITNNRYEAQDGDYVDLITDDDVDTNPASAPKEVV